MNTSKALAKLANVSHETIHKVEEQVAKEAKEVSSALIAAEQRIGELLLSIPKASENQYTSASSTLVEKPKTKTETVKEMGYTKSEMRMV